MSNMLLTSCAAPVGPFNNKSTEQTMCLCGY